ncbi:O-antigen ligase family protein [Dyella sp. A6]|uniref:O-antigen ligase family protein n=1 Tax=Dyella aluminiiresistens TaxID=3069105 RepID=UPI002E7A14F3|nr:O-antigen ligase family protein [Dyella sp. A6]
MNGSNLTGSRFWSVTLGLGIAWMMVGMLVMPSGISYNPGRQYQYSLALLLYLPSLYAAIRLRAAWWRELWPQPAFRVFLALLAWAMLSLTWSTVHRPGDELGRILSVLLFVLGCHLWAGTRPERMRGLLPVAGCVMSLCALYYTAKFLRSAPVPGDRIVGDGVIATANYAAAALGAVCVWLGQLLPRRRFYMVACMLALLAALGFVLLTQSRSVWLALACCALATPLWYRRRLTVSVALAVLVLIVVLAVRPLPVLLERGASYRPQILVQAMHLIAQHPLRGWGQGAPFVINVGDLHLVHSHNILTQTAIELGLPGLLLMMAMWALVAWSGWRHRTQPLGRVVLGLWVYASVALQFDMPQLLDSPRPGWLLIWLPFVLSLGLEARARAAANSAASRTLDAPMPR